MFRCPKCGDRLEGDGYTKVIHCPNANDEHFEGKEPNSNPVYCVPDFASEESEDKIHSVDKFTVCLISSLFRSVRNFSDIESEVIDHLESSAVLEALIEGREVILAKENPECASEAIQFALGTEDGLNFLRLWNEGEFDIIRKEWPEAPESIYIGADPMLNKEII